MELLNELFGLEEGKLIFYQMLMRAIVTFFAALLFIRISGIRTLGRLTAFDVLTTLIMGSILGRGVVAADQPFFQALVAVLGLMLLRRLLASITFKSHKLGIFFKGKPLLLYSDGSKTSNVAKAHVTDEDIKEAVRQELNTDDLKKVREIYLERSGELSILRKE